ncbi:MAG: TerC family protein [Bacteroidetes bacterium]|nr:TerC family protein [Bacteroidota bacterium]
MEELLSSAGIISLVSLTFMEIVLGIDNIIFVSIIAGRAEKKDQKRVRNIGLFLAMILRLALLFLIQLINDASNPIFTIPLEILREGAKISIKDLVLIGGGLFLIYKSTTEIHHKFNVDEHIETERKTKQKFNAIIVQILLLNIVFSIDSIVTAIGLTQNIIIMMIAIILSMVIMLLVSNSISNFVDKHPTVKMLALSFLLMIGFTLILEAFEIHVPKGYLYFAMAFSLLVEMLNIRLRVKKEKI